MTPCLVALQSVAASGQYLAVGAASGSTLVFQLPVAQAPAAQGQAPPHPTHSTGSGHSPLPGGAAMWQLGAVAGSERGGLGFDPVCSLGFSTVGTPGDALWLAVGHVSGALTVWELQKRGPRQIAGIGGWPSKRWSMAVTHQTGAVFVGMGSQDALLYQHVGCPRDVSRHGVCLLCPQNTAHWCDVSASPLQHSTAAASHSRPSCLAGQPACCCQETCGELQQPGCWSSANSWDFVAAATAAATGSQGPLLSRNQNTTQLHILHPKTCFQVLS